MVSAAIIATVIELDRALCGQVPRAALLACVEGAYADLAGSIAADALPEMVARLVSERLVGASVLHGP